MLYGAGFFVVMSSENILCEHFHCTNNSLFQIVPHHTHTGFPEMRYTGRPRARTRDFRGGDYPPYLYILVLSFHPDDPLTLLTPLILPTLPIKLTMQPCQRD
jgi:hypothetical protein